MKAKKSSNKIYFLSNLIHSIRAVGSTDKLEFDYVYKFDIRIERTHVYDNCKFSNIYEDR